MPASYTIAPNRPFLYQGVRIRYVGRGRDQDRTLLFARDDRFQVRFTPDELSKERDAGTLQDWREEPEKVEGARKVAVRNTIARSTAQEKARCDRALDYCMSWQAEPGLARSRASLETLIAKVYGRRAEEASREQRFEPGPPSSSTLQKWLAKWLEKDRTAEALVPQNSLKGNRRPKLDHFVINELHEFIEDEYLVQNGPTVAELHRKFKKHLAEEDAQLHPQDRRRPPSYKAVCDHVGSLCGYTVMYCRRGKAVANEHFRSIGPGLVTQQANEVWEVDDTLCDLMCVGMDGKVIGRPWLIIVIDRHTRMIMGFLLTFTPPDTAAVMEVLKQAMLRKEAMLQQMEVGSEWMAHGRPTEIHVDNAKHYNSKVLKTALSRLGIALHTMPVLKAWYKGTVERAIGTVMRQVFHLVPGTTYSSIFERDRQDIPEVVAETTIAEARRKLLKWVVNDYQRRHHRGIDAAPAVLWKQGEKKGDLRLPLQRTDIENELSVTVARIPRKEGLVFESLIYTSEHVTQVRMLPKNDRPEELLVRVDPANLTGISFLHPVSGEWLPAYLRRDLLPRVVNRTLQEYRLARVLFKNRPEDFMDEVAWTDVYEAEEASRVSKAESRKLRPRMQAEGDRERIAKQANRLSANGNDEMAEQGDDLDSLVQAAVGRRPEPLAAPPDLAGPPPVAHPATPEDDDDQLERWAASNGLSATTHDEETGG